MKRLMSIIEGMAVISFLAVVISCQEYLPFDDHDLTVQTYEKDFVSTFGKPAENHQWGFVQQPIIDYSAGQTRACLTNSNQWNKEFGLDVPVPLTADQKNTVTKWFEEHQNPSSITINWADYFVQQVSSSQYGNNMNYMCDGDTHIQRFNSGKGSSTNVEMADGTVWYDEIIYMHDQPYNDFSYYESFGSTLMKNHYVLVLGSTIDPQNEHGLAGMFFLGFDYEAQGQNDNQKIARDYFFNDWIVKITPANSQFNSDNRIVRVLCEDLGNDEADFDYNDIVFDVSFIKEDGIPKAKITIQAVSGTLPIYVGIHPSSANSDLYEAHYLVGENELRPVNRPNATANYTVPLSDMGINTDGNITYASAKDIPIYVVGENGVHEIGNSVIPQKIACSVNAVWPTEGQRIDNCYEHFKDWIVDESANMEWVTETANTNNNQNTQAPEEETQTPEEDNREETQQPENTEKEDTEEPEGAVNFTNAGISYSGMTCYAISKEELQMVAKNVTGPFEITVTGKGVAYNESAVELVYDLSHPEWGAGQHQVTAFGNTRKSIGSGATDKAPVQLSTTLTAAQVETLFGDSNFLEGALLVAVSNISDVKLYVK